MMPTDAISLRDAYGELLLELAAADDRIVVLDADLAQSTRTAAFKARHPERYVNVGIAEQNMVSFAAGIALAKGIPFVNTFAAFLTRRAADQIALSVAYPELDVKFFGFHAGVNLGEDGATQQSVEDLGIMQAIPGIRVYAPVDAIDLDWCMRAALATPGPTYIRLARFPSPRQLGEAVESAGYRYLRTGSGPVVLTTGTIAAEVLQAVDQLVVESEPVAVIGVRQIKPIDPHLAATLAPVAEHLAVVEEHNVHGGLADALSTALDAAGLVHRIERIGVPDRFGESGAPRALLEHLGLAGDPLRERLQKWAESKSNGGALQE